ncbi:sigma-54-dependent transcriptional regulator [Paraburkholderia susongensis]|uniref:Sigma54 specific transcriptional regulator, Fis family n=1 Tax=Paraburkholderia susongensis TaxID=1515439 RepID=A0A1X7LR45_9BURK|nr:sigma-54 dependent transcriptional regulator [Paraburkholderia susongensis]SMG56140.1 sigma54 specific transcriptional regulator, Fis family [Paraburkholderia susongensis]
MTTICTPADTERTVLYVANLPDPKLVAFLAASGWQAVHAKSTAIAERMIERGNIKVGLVQLPEDSTSQQLSALASCMCGVQTNWVAQIVPGQTKNELVSRFILDYCFDFVTQPWLNERLVFALGHAHGLSSLRQPRAAPEPSLGRHGMVGQCEAMQQLYRRIDKCSVTEAPVFIAGESGTGKELTARAIHERSPRAGRSFVAINCAAIPPSLLQAELFGHERGAFTGALQRKIGRIESAHEGTLFLDEIGDMPHECQAVLLRFLQEGTIERLGGNGPISVNVRVISATHVDLDRAVEDGRFRSDLYHRLCVLRLVEPPLRERGGDIKLLANYALSLYKQDGARKLRGLSSDAIVAMSNYTWPGNVRELINCVRRAVVMSEGRFITASDLGLPEADHGPAVTLAEIRSKAEKDAIERALLRHGYKLSDAAAELGISRATLYRLMHANRLHPEPGAARGANGGGADADDEAERQASSVA